MQTDTQASGQAATSLERRIDMSVPMAEVEKEVAQRLRQISKTAKMAGFRPGKVPLKIVEQQYGGQARSEAIGAAVERAFGQKVREQKLRVAGSPRIEPKQGGDAAAFEFSAVFEVYPDIVVGDLSAQAIEKPVLEVTEAEIEKTIEALRKQRTRFLPADRAAQKGDRVVIDFVGRKNGEEFQGGRATDHAMLVGSGRMLPDFEAAIEGSRAGDAKTFDMTFPGDYQAVELAGQTVQFDVKVKSVEAPELPAVDAEFARNLGIKDGDLDKMRAEVQSNLEREVRRRLQARLKNQVMDLLLAVTPIEVPAALVNMEAGQMAERAWNDLQQRGIAVKDMPVEPSWFVEPATRRVKLGLILAELVKAKDLQAKPAQVRAVVEELAETFEDAQEVVRWYYAQPQRLAEAEALALENNVVDWALAQAKVTEKAVAFDDLMENAA